MTDDLFERAKRRVTARLVGSRHIQFGDIDTGSESPKDALTYVSYYAHRIGNHFIRSGEYSFILSNGFLQSHIYNLAVALIAFRDEPDSLENALRFNFKKFYAECCLGVQNCFIGRSLLLETMLFEQETMEQAFERVDRELASRVAGVMTHMLNLHELNHHFAKLHGNGWWDEMRRIEGGRLAGRLEKWFETYPKSMVVELACDAVAISIHLSDNADTTNDFDKQTRARMAAFCFLAFRELAALERSAQEAARNSISEDKAVQLGSEFRRRSAPNVPIGRLQEMEIRCDEALSLIVEDYSVNNLYGAAGFFPLPDTCDDTMRLSFETFFETAENHEGCGTTDRQRGLVQIVAESMHGHDKGMEHLLWRSKQFNIGGEELDPKSE